MYTKTTIVLVLAMVTALTVTVTVTATPQRANAYLGSVFQCGHGQVYSNGHYWYHYDYCQNEYNPGGGMTAQYTDTYWYYWNGSQWVGYGWTGWHQTCCPGPVLLWKVGQTAELIKTPTYKGDVVAAACNVIGDNETAKTFTLNCHEQTQLPAGTNSTNPQHLDNNIKPIFGGPLISWGPGFTQPPSR